MLIHFLLLKLKMIYDKDLVRNYILSLYNLLYCASNKSVTPYYMSMSNIMSECANI